VECQHAAECVLVQRLERKLVRGVQWKLRY
jgi:hypothetical protein